MTEMKSPNSWRNEQQEQSDIKATSFDEEESIAASGQKQQLITIENQQTGLDIHPKRISRLSIQVNDKENTFPVDLGAPPLRKVPQFRESQAYITDRIENEITDESKQSQPIEFLQGNNDYLSSFRSSSQFSNLVIKDPRKSIVGSQVVRDQNLQLVLSSKLPHPSESPNTNKQTVVIGDEESAADGQLDNIRIHSMYAASESPDRQEEQKCDSELFSFVRTITKKSEQEEAPGLFMPSNVRLDCEGTEVELDTEGQQPEIVYPK